MDEAVALTILSRSADRSLIRVGGEIDHHTVGVLADALTTLSGDVVVDLAAVEFLGAVGVNVLVVHQRRLHESGGSLTVRDASPPARRVLEICGVLARLENQDGAQTFS